MSTDDQRYVSHFVCLLVIAVGLSANVLRAYSYNIYSIFSMEFFYVTHVF